MKTKFFKHLIAMLLAIASVICTVPTALAADSIVSNATVSESMSAGILPEHPGDKTAKANHTELDYSNASDGYVMIQVKSQDNKYLKCRVKFGTRKYYTYDLIANQWLALPLTYGSGEYQIQIFKQNAGTNYAILLDKRITADIKNENELYLISNYYIDYADSSEAVAKAEELCKDLDNYRAKIDAVYNYVVDNVKYDKVLAASKPVRYVPDLDAVLETGTGICFDYASLMAGMLRSQGVPCRVVFGYVEHCYHAWVEAYDGENWLHMDPTFVSQGKRKPAIVNYVNDLDNYTALYMF